MFIFRCVAADTVRCGDVGVSHWKFSSDYFNLLSKERKNSKKEKQSNRRIGKRYELACHKRTPTGHCI